MLFEVDILSQENDMWNLEYQYFYLFAFVKKKKIMMGYFFYLQVAKDVQLYNNNRMELNTNKLNQIGILC